MKSLSIFGLLILAFIVTGCGGDADMPTASSAMSTATFTATLLTASEVPPVTGAEGTGSGSATLTFNLSKDGGGDITAATMDASVSVTGFPPGTTLTASHIHPGAAGTNGAVFVSLGLTQGEISFPSGSGSFAKRGVTLTVDQANTILANPGAFYLNIHTAQNPDGVARGQLRAQ
jgi:hypothetical protein